VTGILWGLLGAVFIGASDCVARVTAQRVSSSVLFLLIMGLGLSVLSVYLAFTTDWPTWHAWGWGTSAISGLLNLVALYFLYKALARGPVAVASPAASTFTVLLVLLNILAGQPWTWLQVAALIIVFFGIVMLAQPAEADRSNVQYDPQWLRTTAMFGLLAAIAVAMRMFLAQEAGSVLGPLHALYLNRLFALLGSIALIVWLIVRSEEIAWPKGNTRYLVFIQAVFETAALGSFLFGSAAGDRVSATIGFSTFAAATALFAWWWLGEKIGLKRGVWIAVVAAGICLSAIGGTQA